jgi:uroporphyrinogen-III decarboxylase
MACFDKPDWVHRLLGILLKKKLRFIEESLDGTKFDLIETGGGAGSDTVVSPNMHREFCLPYDKKLHDAVKSCGLKVVYHTCGGQMFLGDQILANGCSASETLSPPGCGGNITEPEKVREEFGGKIAMIGGIDQFNVVTSGGREEIRRAVHRMFEGYGRDGGYVMSACDHFFETPVENLKMFGEAARECVY